MWLIPGGRKKFEQRVISCPSCGCTLIIVEGYQVERLKIETKCPGCKEKINIGEKTLNMYLETNIPPNHSSLD